NDKNLYQTENNKLKEELQCISSRYDDNKTELERYYNIIQRTNYVLQKVFGSNEIDIRQLEDLCNEIGEICDKDFVSCYNIQTISNNIVYNSFDDALNASEEKITEIVENGREQFLPLVRSRCFYDANEKEFDTDKFNF
ncbi:17240_t:CDS:2, partial [Dentiscutata erythropus]